MHVTFEHFRANWGIGSGTLANLFIPERANEPEALQELKQLQRESATPETVAFADTAITVVVQATVSGDAFTADPLAVVIR